MARKVRRKGKIGTRRKVSGKGAPGAAGTEGLDGDAPSGVIAAPDGDDVPRFLRHQNRGRKVKASGPGATDLDDDLNQEEVGESGRSTVTGVAGKGSGGFGGDGFEGQQDSRSAYESYMKDHIRADADRFESLRQEGVVDEFDPMSSPRDVESKGHFATANHMVRMFEQWLLDTPERNVTVDKAATWLSGLSRPDAVRKVLTELESKPIRDVYPLEVMMRVMETSPGKLPGMRRGHVVGPQLQDKMREGIFAGHPIQLDIPPNHRIKAFAQLGGGRPGYEFYPSTKDGQYTFLVDTPGEWEFALLAVQTQKLGKMDREMQGGTVEKFKIQVKEMGRKVS